MRRRIIMIALLFPVLAGLSFSGGVAAAATPVDPACAAPAVNSPKDQVLTGTGQAGPTDCGTAAASLSNTVVTILSIVVGIVAVFMVVLAGFKYITSAGDSNKTASAKATLVYAIIGLVVVALAQIIVHFTINTAVGAAK